jgi:hypothetical protein
MCSPESSEHQPISARAFVHNWQQPGPLGWKLRRLVANTAIKVARCQRCCGNGGEPGW